MSAKKENVELITIGNVAFMICPNCKKEILLDVNKINFCRNCRHKIAYKLVKDRRFNVGFKSIIYSPIKNFRKEHLEEVFSNENRKRNKGIIR